MGKFIKNFWKWMSHGDTIWGIMNILFPTLGATGGGVISWITSVHPLVWFFAIFAGIALGIFISNEIAARRLRGKVLPLREKPVEIRQSLDWLEEVLHSNRNELGRRIISHDNQWIFEGISKTEPFFEVIIGITNAAIFPIVITGINGSLEVKGTLCNMPAILLGGGTFPHFHHANIRIRQNITLETAKTIIEIRDKGQKLNVSFRECWFVVQAKEPDHQTNPTHVSIVDGSTVSISIE